jgi:hypothetical protein
MATKKAVKEETSMTKFDEMWAKEAESLKSITDINASKFISLAGGTMRYNNAEIPDNTLECLVLGACFANLMYDGDYDPDNVTPPACYAFGEDQKEMSPDPEHPMTNNRVEGGEATSCQDCPNNEWGSAEKGDGKACGNKMRLALLSVSDIETADAVKTAEPAFVHVPVTSVKAFRLYAKQLAANYGRPPHGVVTTMELVPDKKTQFALTFKFSEKITDGAVGKALVEAHAKMEEAIRFPYTLITKEPVAKKAAPAKKGGKRKF